MCCESVPTSGNTPLSAPGIGDTGPGEGIAIWIALVVGPIPPSTEVCDTLRLRPAETVPEPSTMATIGNSGWIPETSQAEVEPESADARGTACFTTGGAACEATFGREVIAGAGNGKHPVGDA